MPWCTPSTCCFSRRYVCGLPSLPHSSSSQKGCSFHLCEGSAWHSLGTGAQQTILGKKKKKKEGGGICHCGAHTTINGRMLSADYTPGKADARTHVPIAEHLCFAVHQALFPPLILCDPGNILLSQIEKLRCQRLARVPQQPTRARR